VKVLVTGARDWANRAAVRRELSKLQRGPETILVHGACPTGADAIADEIGREFGFTVRPYPADWDEAERRGNRNSAGPVRNSDMIRKEHPDKDGVPFDFGLSFSTNLDRDRGTRDCTTKARKAGIRMDVHAS